MARYYSGDINGKFWFGVQDSHCADRFGYVGEPNFITYCFDESHLPQIESELEHIRTNLGELLPKLDAFFKENGSYNDESLSSYLGIPDNKLYRYLVEYADYKMGLEIKSCIEQNGDCCFDAEL